VHSPEQILAARRRSLDRALALLAGLLTGVSLVLITDLAFPALAAWQLHGGL